MIKIIVFIKEKDHLFRPGQNDVFEPQIGVLGLMSFQGLGSRVVGDARQGQARQGQARQGRGEGGPQSPPPRTPPPYPTKRHVCQRLGGSRVVLGSQNGETGLGAEKCSKSSFLQKKKFIF